MLQLRNGNLFPTSPTGPAASPESDAVPSLRHTWRCRFVSHPAGGQAVINEAGQADKGATHDADAITRTKARLLERYHVTIGGGAGQKAPAPLVPAPPSQAFGQKR